MKLPEDKTQLTGRSKAEEGEMSEWQRFPDNFIPYSKHHLQPKLSKVYTPLYQITIGSGMNS